MDITDVRWTYDESGLPLLKLKLDGVEATILPQQKPYLLDNGIVTVLLSAGQEELLSEVRVPGNKELGIKGFTLDGATADKRIVSLTREFVAAVERGTFEEREIG